MRISKKIKPTKVCPKCGEEKNRQEGFYARSGNNNYVSSYCKVCLIAHARAWIKANPERAKQHVQTYLNKRKKNVKTS